MVSIVKKGIIARNHPWQERKDIIFRVEFGISPIGVINEIFLTIPVNDDINIHNPIDVFWAISTRTNPEADILVDQFPADTKTDDRGIPPSPIKRPLKGARYRTGINAAIVRKNDKVFLKYSQPYIDPK